MAQDQDLAADAQGGGKDNGHRGDLLWGVIIFLLALTVRCIFQWEIKDHPLSRQLFLDPAFYDRWARAIAAGDWLSREQGIFYANPLYSYFLAIIYSLFGHTLFGVRLIQSLLGSGLCVMLFLTGRRMLNRTGGVLAGLLAALYAPFIFYEGTVTISTLGLFLSALVVLMLVIRRTPGKGISLTAGLSWGLRALARFDATVLAALGWLLGFPNGASARRRILLALLFCMGVCAVILPVTVRNYLVGGKLVAITAHGGETFYGGNNPRAEGIYTPAPGVRPGTEYEHEDFRRLAGQRVGRELTLAESSSFWLREALDFIREHPGQWFRLELRKLWLFWSPQEIPDNRNFHFFKRYSMILRLPLVNFAVLCPLALLGMAVGLGAWRRLLLLYLQVLFSMLSVLLFFVSSRYRLPTVPFLIIFAAHGLTWSYEKLKRRRWRLLLAAWVPTVALLIFMGLAARGLDRGAFPARRETMGVALIREGRVEEGIVQLEDVIQLSPDRVTAHFNLGVAYLEERKQPNRAAREFRRVIQLQENYPQAHYMLAQAYYAMDRFEEALEVLHQEVPIGFQDDILRLELEAMLMVKLEQWDKAQETFQHLIELNPGNSGAHRSLGNVLYLQGKWDEAMKSWERALQLDPADEGLRENLEKLQTNIGERNGKRQGREN